jgi:hypothetical protein
VGTATRRSGRAQLDIASRGDPENSHHFTGLESVHGTWGTARARIFMSSSRKINFGWPEKALYFLARAENPRSRQPLLLQRGFP